IDSNMGHAYVAAEGCDEAVLLGVCSAADEQLMESLMKLHGDDAPALGTVRAVEPANSAAPMTRGRGRKVRSR
ncbi:MAG TPA: XRE family transcriptional regulator, partial [Pseudomonadota bacterium]|nr:XRE family transcriptional regulator [Pseudomonadota bacterium]